MTVMWGVGCVLMDGLKKWHNGGIRGESEDKLAAELMFGLLYSRDGQCWENRDWLIDRLREEDSSSGDG